MIKNLRKKSTDRPTDGRTDGQTEQWTDGQTLLQSRLDATKNLYCIELQNILSQMTHKRHSRIANVMPDSRTTYGQLAKIADDSLMLQMTHHYAGWIPWKCQKLLMPARIIMTF